ncbi:putative mRNA-splicing protein ubp10 AltName: Full=Probable inactive ubiquitin-specific-processing protease 10 [Rhizoctonia solani AG-1 IB]|uniref:Ubp10 protein n=1 Tax=Thanatephorus cucumeris (strain AG1-IB / isolate 7/3/14) TaxID=1108050 RepID=M5BWH5_THACB|nr:putative mRNA-splicing protein ubp10 AltName: Full=Probable inactive ubiquitin-specific-processing protease 10 [Rhizoctonia solani AG-1 IB]
MEPTTRLTPDDRPTKRAKTEEPEESMNVPESNSAKKEEPAVDDLDDEDPYAGYEEKQENTRAADLYLDTVNRAALDFDFEKYFQGRGKSSHAYAHSIHEDHHVFIHLETTEVYVLPDGYQVSDPSLDDIKYVLSPRFSPAQITKLRADNVQTSYDLLSRPYIPGYVGLQNIKRNDYLSVIIQALLHVPPVRDFLLAMDGSTQSAPKPKPSAAPAKPIKQPSELVRRFAGLAKKVWNPRLFKSQVSPHEFLQEVARVSTGKFKITEQGDPVEFLGWLLNRIHADLGGTKKRGSSIIYSAFQGEVRLETQQVIVTADAGSGVKPHFDIDREIKQTTTPFLLLALDLPPPPLFQDAVEKNIIPQVSLASLLAKYDGTTTQEFAGQLKRFRCTKLPPYIILHFKRFTKNNFVEERNPTIVNFPIDGVDFSQVLERPPESAAMPIIYDLVANVTQESAVGTTHDKESTVWKIHVRAGRGEREQWFQIQDMIVEETRKEMIFLGETVVQIWELSRRAPGKGKEKA